MYNQEIFEKFTSQFGDLAAPAKKFNATVLDNLEKLANFQLEAARSYTDLGLQQLRSALEVSDAESLQAYVSQQSKVAENVSQKISADASTLANLSKDFGSDIQKLAQENVTVLNQAAQNAQPKAAKAPARKSA